MMLLGVYMRGDGAQAREWKAVSIRRVLAIACLGPLIGLSLYYGAGFLMDPPTETLSGLVQIYFFILILGWPLALVPSTIGAIAWRFMPLPKGRAGRLAMALAIGAAAGVLGMVLVSALMQTKPMPLPIVAIMALAGAASLAGTALPFSRRP
jgi:hypothetical protein